MEVAVITRHAIANYGSLLQAAATQNAIEALGHSCRIIDYVRPNEVCTQLHKCQLQQKPRWNRTPLRRRVYSTLRYTENVMAGRLFESARRQMLHLTEPFSTAQELTANGPKADVYMTGSDQVWGPMEDGTYDPVYRLAFVRRRAQKRWPTPPALAAQSCPSPCGGSSAGICGNIPASPCGRTAPLRCCGSLDWRASR